MTVWMERMDKGHRPQSLADINDMLRDGVSQLLGDLVLTFIRRRSGHLLEQQEGHGPGATSP